MGVEPGADQCGQEQARTLQRLTHSFSSFYTLKNMFSFVCFNWLQWVLVAARRIPHLGAA